MTIEEALCKKLESVLGHTRIYPDGDIPQGQNLWPCVVFDHLGDDDRILLSGGRAKTRIDSFTLEIIGKTRASVSATRDVIKTAFSGANCAGTWGGVGGLRITGAIASEPQADAEGPIDGTEDLDRLERITLRINWIGV
jgi:hypothetical protein